MGDGEALCRPVRLTSRVHIGRVVFFPGKRERSSGGELHRRQGKGESESRDEIKVADCPLFL